MKITIKILGFFILIGLILMPGFNAFAESTDIKLDENIGQEQLKLEDPGLLPTSPFYFFKNTFQKVRSALTFNPVKKAQLKMRYANQKILEAKELAKEKRNSEFVSKSIERYQKNVEDVSHITKKAKEKIKQKDKEFVNKTLDQILKQNKLLDNIEKDISKTIKEKIRQAREKANQNNAQILSNTADQKTFKKQIQESVKSQKGDTFKEFKDMEILKKIQNHSPEKIKNIIKESNNYTLSSFKEKLNNMPAEERKKFDQYIDNAGGDNVTHFQLLQELEKGSPKEIKEQVKKARERVMKNIENRIQNKENVLKTLENGDMDNLSTIQELEEGIAPGLVEKVMDAKHKALNNFKKKMENAKSKEERNKMLEQAKENANINKLQIFNEIEENVSEEDKDFVKQMIEEVNKEIEDKINSAPVNNKDEMLKEIAGSSPGAIETAQKMISDPRLKGRVFQAQIENLKKKIKTSEDPEKIETLKEKLEQNMEIRQIIRQKAPEIDHNLEQKREQYMNQINQEKAKKQLERANKQLSDLKKHFQKLQNQYPEFETALKQGPALNLMEKANDRLKEIKTKLKNKKYGEAFGIATSTMNITNNAYKAIKKFESQTIMKQERVRKNTQNIEQQGQKILQDLINSGVLNDKEVKDIKEKLEQGKIQEIIKEYKDKIPTPSNMSPSQEGRGQAPGQNQGPDKPSQDLEEFNIESYLKQSGLSQEKINKIKENLENVPDDIKERIKQFPTEMLLKASQSLQKGIQKPLQIDKDIEKEQDMEQERERELDKEKALEKERDSEMEQDRQYNQRSESPPYSSSENSGPCAQVITPAVKDGVCKKFPTPCDVPQGWQKVDKCPPSVEDQIPIQKRDHAKERELEKNKEREKEQKHEYEHEIDKTPKQTQEQKEIKKDTPNKPVSSDSNIELHCQNFPPPSFCPGGVEDIIVVGKDKNGCSIYDCKSSTKPQPKEVNENNITPPAPNSIKENLEKSKSQNKKSQKASSTGSLLKNVMNFFK